MEQVENTQRIKVIRDFTRGRTAEGQAQGTTWQVADDNWLIMAGWNSLSSHQDLHIMSLKTGEKTKMLNVNKVHVMSM